MKSLCFQKPPLSPKIDSLRFVHWVAEDVPTFVAFLYHILALLPLILLRKIDWLISPWVEVEHNHHPDLENVKGDGETRHQFQDTWL